MKNVIAVRVNNENNAEIWWDSLRESYPSFAGSLARNQAAVIDAALWTELAALPGFGGDQNAAIIDCGWEGDQWETIVAGRHHVFTELR